MDKNNGLFDRIAKIYGFFYNSQKNNYNEILDKIKKDLNLSSYSKIVDIGCGTGALCSVLNERGFVVTGVDSAQKMLDIAAGKPENRDIEFIQASAVERLPFEDNSFDVSIAAYVAHGLKENERKIMYAEMSRISKHLVILHDYNENRGVFTDIIEWLERGDYFNFIKKVKYELKETFSDVNVINVAEKAAWYVCSTSNS